MNVYHGINAFMLITILVFIVICVLSNKAWDKKLEADTKRMNEENAEILRKHKEEVKSLMDKLNTPEGGYVTVYVGCWCTSRKVFINRDEVAFQVTRQNCPSCSRCEERIEEVLRVLTKKSINHKWLRLGGVAWVSLSRKEGEDPIVTLETALEGGITARL